ncbi:MAG: hypothetical protein Q4D62_08815 [Planctomycetia bacterium]|nr:hypothetical protein [Planctomycetia bacterium]
MRVRSLWIFPLVGWILSFGATLQAATEAEVQAAEAVLDKMMASYQKDAAGNIVSFDLTDRICTNEDLAVLCKLDTVTQCKIYGANLKPGGAGVIVGLKSCKKLSIENTDFVDADMAFLAQMPWVEELTLRRNTYLGAETIGFVAQLPKLRNLVLLYGNFDDASLAKLSTVKTLRLLDVRGCAAVTDMGLAVLKELPNLIVIKLRCTAVTNFGIENIRGKKLKTFDIEDSQTFSDEAIDYLDGMQDSLQEIIIMRCIAVSDDGVKKLASMKNMRKMNLRGNYIGSDALEACKEMAELRLLCVSETFVDDAGLVYLENLSKLEHLDLWLTNVSDVGMDSVAKLSSLKVLSLVGTKVTDAGIEKLSGLKNLESLDLGELMITDACLPFLEKCVSLKKLSVRATQISTQGVETLKKSLPNCAINY